jgi:hypothetical protein
MPPDRALADLHRKLRSHHVLLTAVKCDGNNGERMAVSPADLNNLVIRFTPGGTSVTSVGLWSRSRGNLVWESLQFLRANVIRAWPARNTKTAAIGVAILRHLREITTPEAPITKLEAQQRCLAEVRNAYPEAFKKAWAELETSCKRGRGKHGPRAH